jgi:hypothetical protein
MQVMLQACRMAAVPQMGITTHSGRAVDRFAEDAATTKMAGVRVKMRSMLVAKGAAVAQAVWAGERRAARGRFESTCAQSAS